MPESEPGLSRDAFCYAGGVLAGADALAFEQRLGEDQAAREALADAAARLQGLSEAPLAPDPGYRAAVVRRLGGGGLWHRLARPRRYPGHPVLWALSGAAAAVVLLGLYAPRPRGAFPGASAVNSTLAPDTAPDSTALGGATLLDPPEVAEVWATLQNHRRLSEAHEDVVRRRRPEARPQVSDDVNPGSPSELPQVMD